MVSVDSKGVRYSAVSVLLAALAIACSSPSRVYGDGQGGAGGKAGSAGASAAGSASVGGHDGGASAMAGEGGDGGSPEDGAAGSSTGDCSMDPCLNGTCIDGTSAYTCTCAPGFSGQHCERAVSTCDDEPCLNDGTCVDQAGSYKCTCLEGFSGTNCELNVDDCAGDPCENGGGCVDRVNGYTCHCKAGYTGTTCQTDVDDCASDPCQNGGDCKDGVNAHTCVCTNRYTGPNCEYLEVKLAPDNLSAASYTTTATALSNDGKVLLFQYADADGRSVGRLVDFDAGNLVSLGPSLTDDDAYGYGIDNDGATIVGAARPTDDSLLRAFKHVGNTSSLFDVTQVQYASAPQQANDVSADGATVVGAMTPGSGITAGFYCKGAQACKDVPVEGTGWQQIWPSSVSGDGSVIVGYAYNFSPASGMAWRWVTSSAKGTALALGAATWTSPRANAVSRDGLVVVGEAQINGVSHAVRWSGASFTSADLGTGKAKGTSADGSVTVGVDNANVPLVWLGTTRQTLASLLGTNPDLSGATLTDLVAVSDDGKVVGGTAKVGGVEHAFMARLP